MLRWSIPALALLLAVSSPDVRANGAPGPRPVVHEAKLFVAVDENIKKPKLVVSSALLAQPAVPPNGRPGVSLPVIFSGVALSLSFVSGGFWLLRNRTSRRVAALLVAGSLLAFGASALWADLGPKPNPAPAPIKNQIKLPAGLQLTEDITVVVVPFNAAPPGSVTLLVPKDSVLTKEKATETPKQDE
jgi:hypothetical protein